MWASLLSFSCIEIYVPPNGRLRAREEFFLFHHFLLVLIGAFVRRMGNGAGSSRLCENIIDKCIDRFTIYASGQSSYGQVIFVDSSVSNA